MRPVMRGIVVAAATAVLAAVAPSIASADASLSASLSLSPAGPYDVNQHTQGTVTVTGGSAGATYSVGAGSDGCSSWGSGSGTGPVQVDVQVYCDTSVVIPVEETATDGTTNSTTTNSVGVQIRRLANPTLTLTTPPPYAKGESITGTVTAVDQNQQPFPKAFIDDASDGCMSMSRTAADGNGVITVQMTLSCDDAISLPVTAVSNDGTSTDDQQFTPPVNVTLAPPQQPTLQVSPAGPYHSGQVVTATIHVLDGAGHPVQGATVEDSRDSCLSWPAATSDASGTIALPVTVTCGESLQVYVFVDRSPLLTPIVQLSVYAPISLSAPTTTVKRPYYVVALAPHVPDIARYDARHIYVQTSQDLTHWRSASDLASFSTTPGNAVWFPKAGAAYARLVFSGGNQFIDTVSNTVTLHVSSGKVPWWLTQFNHYRALAGAPPVGEDPHFDAADAAHVRYLSHLGYLSHPEDPHNKYYSRLGNLGGTSSELYQGLNPVDVIPGWLSTPFHQIGMLEPSLYTTGFATYHGYSALFVFGASQATPGVPANPVWPRDKGSMPLHVFPGNETPDPLNYCPKSYRRAASRTGVGAALLAMFTNPHKTGTPSAALYDNGKRVSVCAWGEGYSTPDGHNQFLVHLLPLARQRGHHHYRVVVHMGGQTRTWGFTG